MTLSVYLKRTLTLQSKKGTNTSSLMATNCLGQIIQVIQNEVVLSFTKKLCIVKSLSFNECTICKVSIQNSKGYVGVVYRSPSQNIFEFEIFLSKFEKVLSDTTLCNSLFTIILGDFHAKSSVWWTRDKTTIEGTQLESLSSVHGFHQLISQPTHLLPQTSSCIDLIFTDQPNLIVDSGIHPSLHSNCHHQITCCKINLNTEYQPPYEHLVWECIKKSIESVNWEVMFNNKQFHKQVSIFNEVLRNIFSNFTPNKLVTFDDRDPPWLNDFVKSKIKWKNQLHKIYTKNGYKYNDYVQLKEATVLVSQVIAKRKEDCHNVLASKLNNPKTSAKAYWSILIILQ